MNNLTLANLREGLNFSDKFNLKKIDNSHSIIQRMQENANIKQCNDILLYDLYFDDGEYCEHKDGKQIRADWIDVLSIKIYSLRKLIKNFNKAKNDDEKKSLMLDYLSNELNVMDNIKDNVYLYEDKKIIMLYFLEIDKDSDSAIIFEKHVDK